MKNPITILKSIGCKVVDRETTAEAQKWWLSFPPAKDFSEARQKILKALKIENQHYSPFGQSAGEFEVLFLSESIDGYCGVFLAKHCKTPTGKLYHHGIDC